MCTVRSVSTQRTHANLCVCLKCISIHLSAHWFCPSPITVTVQYEYSAIYKMRTYVSIYLYICTKPMAVHMSGLYSSTVVVVVVMQ